MRYTNWDILIFPDDEDTKVPLQEFRTTCDVVQDPATDLVSTSSRTAYFSTITRPSPIVSCFIPSLPMGCPFRVSLYTWERPPITNATKSIIHDENMVVFEAKLLIDGVCVAGAVLDHECKWPYIVENTSCKKDGKPDRLRFPPFHTEILEQTWVDPAQGLGRVKIVIAEGVRSVSNSGFEKIRNIVAFAFQHAPLAILEDTGIAWPNHGMWYQAIPQFKNPLSPRKAKDVDPDSHAHSPRHELGQRRSMMTPASITRATPVNHALDMVYSLKSPIAKGHGESQTCNLEQPMRLPDPFVSDPHPQGELSSSFSKWLREYQTHPPSVSDVTMHDRSTASSSDHDQSMPDYSRPISPNSLQSIQMKDYSRPPSFTSAFSHTFPDAQPPSISSRGASRQALDWEHALSAACSAPMASLQHPTGQNSGETSRIEDTGKNTFATRDSTTEEQSSTFFEEGLAAYSPGRVPFTGIFAPANTRASSAANTPPAATRPSAAKEARESSYSGRTRVTSITTRDGPPSAVRSASEGNVKPRTVSLISTKSNGGSMPKCQTIIKTPSSDVKSRKEGKTASIELDVPPKHQPSLTRTASSSYDKENARIGGETGSPAGDQKRRRVSTQAEVHTLLKIHGYNENGAIDRAPDLDRDSNSPAKDHNDIDNLTAEGIVSRSPLVEIDENLF